MGAHGIGEHETGGTGQREQNEEPRPPKEFLGFGTEPVDPPEVENNMQHAAVQVDGGQNRPVSFKSNFC